MPIYEFVCQTCNNEFELMRSFSDSTTAKCPNCGGVEVQRQLSRPAIHFKGSGWYITDSKKGDNKTGGKNGSESKESADSEKTSDKSESDSGSKADTSEKGTTETKSSDTKSSDAKTTDTKSSEAKAPATTTAAKGEK